MIRRPPRSTRTDTLFPTRRSSDLHYPLGRMEFDADARRNIAERELLLPCRVELRQVCRIREQKCRSTEFGEKHIEVPLASNERLIFLGITSAQRDPDELVHTVVEVREEDRKRVV